MRSFRFLGAGLVLAAALTFSSQGGNPGGAEADRLRVEVSVDKTRPKPGETVQVGAVVRTSDSIDEVDLKEVLLVPTKGPRDLTLKLASRALGLFKGEIRLAADAPSWKPGTGKIVAAFEDGSAMALVNAFGKGVVVTMSLDLASASRIMPAFVRDVFDFALARHGLK